MSDKELLDFMVENAIYPFAAEVERFS